MGVKTDTKGWIYLGPGARVVAQLAGRSDWSAFVLALEGGGVTWLPESATAAEAVEAVLSVEPK